MTAAPAYARGYSFTNHEANHPNDQQPGVSLDNEFDAIAQTTAALIVNAALIQRSDGALANGSVGPDQLSAALTIGLRSIGTWAAGHAYVINDAVWTNNLLYRSLSNHTSASAFATDLAAGKWQQIFDLMPYVLAALQTGAISVNIDTAALQTQINLRAPLAGANVFTAKQTVTVGAATAAGDYLLLKPSDYAAGKPALVARKLATANAWEVAVDDGVGGGGGLNVVGTITLNGSAPWTAGNFDPTAKADVVDLTALAARGAHNRRVAFAR